MAQCDFETLLRDTMGLDAASVGSSTIESAVRLRMDSLRYTRTEDYWERLHTSTDELQELIEAVVVPETWFFRDPDAFAALVRLISEEWLPRHQTAVLRLLSGPCCTGEEPYSMAMALLDAGISRERLKIDAVDISVRALTHAKRGTYGPNSFRGDNLMFRDRYFERTANGYRLPERIRELVDFHYENLLSSDFRVDSVPYDIIFCRNVLIYFDQSTQNKVMKSLDRLLTPSGFLFVGPSETSLATRNGFQSIDLSMSFAFRKAGLGISVPAKTIRSQVPNTIRRSLVQGSHGAVTKCPLPAPSQKATVTQPVDLASAQHLADAGRLQEAAEQCELHLREQGPSAQAYCLLGVLRDAAGDLEGAAKCYRKVLYLEPTHAEALVHLALLFETQGDLNTARRFRERALAGTKGAGQ
jgi:chemotaxis protein methyltransferase WspC